ncbi:serine/threonine-protein kinase AtPK2/AtPK19-like isoform X2 [Zootermopsis nevadensis]|uniref:serine/threonine-protein kinase AtPK2/AtPK19-like isoform X2 n=1 Tax=Zootermopsis nevadensis TaxID=136037 RepID=UPI000B8E860F|nr:serine/threonine-protein kinase AtPK2/AtPK19-like isoform X2 [Zootermopsis nevadensis]
MKKLRRFCFGVSDRPERVQRHKVVTNNGAEKTKARSEMRNSNNKNKYSKQENKKHLTSPNKVNETQKFNACPITGEKINTLRDGFKPVLKNLEDVSAKRGMSANRSENYVHVNAERQTPCERLCEGDILKFELAKMADVLEQQLMTTRTQQEYISRLNEDVNMISIENEKLCVKMAELLEMHNREVKNNEETVNRLNELHDAVDRLLTETAKFNFEMAQHNHSTAKNNDTYIEAGDSTVANRTVRNMKIEKKQDLTNHDVKISRNNRTPTKPGTHETRWRKDEPTQPCPKLKNFKLIEVLGKGAFGTVYLVQKKGGIDDGTFYAMKVINISYSSSGTVCPKEYHTEHRVHINVFDTPFLVGLYYGFLSESKAVFIVEYFSNGDLQKLLRARKKLPEQDARLYLAEIVVAVENLHQTGVIHRDLKPSNILVDSRGHIAVTDYGLCKEFNLDTQSDNSRLYCGTDVYMAPEMINKEEDGAGVDWWSVGVIAYELMTGRKPFTVHDKSQLTLLYRKIVHEAPEFPKSMSCTAKHFISTLLTKDPSERLGQGKYGVQEIKQHPFFNGINWTDVARRDLQMPCPPHASLISMIKSLSAQILTEIPFQNGNIFEVCSYIAPALKNKETDDHSK